MTPEISITSEEAIILIKMGQPINDCTILGELKLIESEIQNYKIEIRNCVVDNLEAQVVQFLQPVKLINCHFKKCDFAIAYFSGGLEMNSCIFEARLNFHEGGHNLNEATISITNCLFKDFVNFLDCVYDGPVIIINNEFVKGTNLLGNQNEVYKVSFEGSVGIENNTGDLKVDGEGYPELPEDPNMFSVNLN